MHQSIVGDKLGHLGFPVFLIARFLSLLADQMALIAIPIAVYVITNDVSWSGIAIAVQWLPRIIFLPILGALVDRYALRGQYAMIDVMRAVLAVSLVFVNDLALMLSVAGLLSLLNGYAFVILEYTVANRFDADELPRNQSLLQMIENLSRVVGPALAGLMLSVVDLGWTMAICAALFACGFGLTLIAFPTQSGGSTKKTKNKDALGLPASFGLLWHVRPLRRLTGLTFGVNLLDGALMTVLPAIVITRLGQSEAVIGYIHSAAAIAVIVTMLILSRVVDRSRVSVLGFAAMAVSIVAVSAMALAPHLSIFVGGFILYMIAHSVFVLFLRVERIRHIPTHSLGIVLGALIAVILSSMPLSGALIALAGSRFSVTTLLFVAIAMTCLSHLYFILSTREES